MNLFFKACSKLQKSIIKSLQSEVHNKWANSSDISKHTFFKIDFFEWHFWIYNFYLHIWHCLKFVGQQKSKLTDYTKPHLSGSKKILFLKRIPAFSWDFNQNLFLTIFLVKSKLSTAKKSKTRTFSRVFHQKKIDNFSREIKVVNS